MLGVPPAVAIAAGLRRPAPAIAAGLAGIVLLHATSDRVLAGPDPEVPPRGPTLTILSANTLGDRGDARTYVRLAREHDVDVFSVQELSPGQDARLRLEGLPTLLPERVVDARSGARGGGLYSRFALTAQPTPGDLDLPRIRPVQPEALVEIPGAPPVVIKSIHPIPPVSRLATPHWADTLRRLPAAEDGRLRILAGDFNASLDHKVLRGVLERGYTDAGDATGDGWRPTWPVGERRPPITIDHVLVDRRIAVEHYSVHAVPGSDHRALVVRVRLPAA